MVMDHREGAFEETVQAMLVENGGYEAGDPANFDAEQALDPSVLFRFLETTQPKRLEQLRTIHGSSYQQKIRRRLEQTLKKRGMLDVLRHGMKDYGVKLDLMYPRPVSRLNPEALDLYYHNLLTVTRQVAYGPNHHNTLDLVLSVNGLPTATIELKTPYTNQNVHHAMKQYREDRSPRDLMFDFKKRALVHFAVDPDEAYMTTKLAGKKTFFLPFNKGYQHGSGNPPNPDGYRTDYLWTEIFPKDSWIDILTRFLHLEVEDEQKNGQMKRKETMIFPRYHQLDAVRSLEADTKASGTGTNYLVQHSAGSGKSNSIAWLSYRLSNLHDETDHPLFDSVIVITDRKVLDRQLQDKIYQFEHKQGVVAKIENHSQELARALEAGTRIIITTLQKFPYILDKAENLKGSRYAVIIDEAHSSQTGESAKSMKEVLSANSLEQAEEKDPSEQDAEDEMLRTMQAHGKQDHLSFYAFTATPKKKTLEMFGTPRGEEQLPEPFHLYSMRQAIEEGFILDVLENYTTYETFFHLSRQIEDDPEVDKKKASRAIARFVSLHPHNISQKAEVMIEHFRRITQHKIQGNAKAMVVTASRLHAVRYKEAFEKYIREKGYTDVKPLVAFSGTVQDEYGQEYTEAGMNQFPESEVPRRFEEEFEVMIVAEKFQTGFDQPLLHTMYVDKKLHGVKAIQTLSRLNRTCPGKEDTFVLDFANKAEDIQEAFQPYYEKTMIDETTDPNMLYDLVDDLEAGQVYTDSEVDAFCQLYFKPDFNIERGVDQRRLHGLLDPAVERFDQKTEEEQELFRDQLNKFVRLYSFLSQIIPFQDLDLHKLHTFGRFFLKKIQRDNGDRETFHIDSNEVELAFYRLQKQQEGTIALESGGDYAVGGHVASGSKKSEDDKDNLSSIIERLNERFATDFNDSDRLSMEAVEEEMYNDIDLAQKARSNSMDNYRYAFEKEFINKWIERMDKDQNIFSKIMDDDEFKEMMMLEMMKRVYERQSQI
ncbi:type I restriction endonuclease subunit R [Salibacterium qingdaonense]|uniref:Type I restriction enzyme, R subunit n=1 Tax=Salibacterium qingdaonense TaxID=266892 RepID=A0A1I4R214_9BACI|nr:DEAD/DEAH box helicase family protein [Salibacterium qingdaonense]SFM46364.1 type I restriction enzyme, R subunit [Salibacterium qingdaonense]